MKLKKYIIYSLISILLFFVVTDSFSQVPPFFSDYIDCSDCPITTDDYISTIEGCNNQSPLFNDDSFYMINQNSTGKTVRLNFIFVQRNDGTGNYLENDPEHQAIFDDIEDIMNATMANLNIASCGGVNIHSKVQFEVNRVYIPDTYLWNNDNDNNPYKCPTRTSWYLLNKAEEIDNDPTIPKGIGIFFTCGLTAYNYNVVNNNPNYSGANYACSMFPTMDMSKGSYVHYPDNFIKYHWMKNWATVQNNQPWIPVVYTWFVNSTAKTILHELGHSFGLHHNYQCPAHNIMNNAGTGCAHDYLSDSQLNKMHRSIALTNIRKFTNEVIDLDPPFIVDDYALIDFDVRMYRDIIIEPGGVIEITCNVLMPGLGKIIIKPGGKLIIDGGKVTSSSNSFWKGIEVWGNSNANQYPDINGNYQQGILELKNGAIIENATTGVVLGGRNQNGNYDWGKAGGIIWVQANNSMTEPSASFINNEWAITFLSYQNTHPIFPDVLQPNRSYFKNAHFEVNDNYPGATYWYKEFVRLWGVHGIAFRGCTFTNQSAVKHGTGILVTPYYRPTGFHVTALCTAQMIPCPNENLDKCIFENLEKAIDAGSAGTTTIRVENAEFINNSYGIKLQNVNNATILSNEFHIGQASADEQIQCGNRASAYGIHMTGCTGFAVEENYFSKASGAPTGNYTGIHCKDSETEYDVIYRNTFDGLSYGNFAEGNNRLTGNDLYGLEYQCNTNTGNSRDFIVTGNDPNKPPQIRGYQGSMSKEAGNTFSTGVQLPDGHFKNTGTQTINYCYNTNPPVYYTDYYVMPIPYAGANTCPSNYGGGSGGLIKDVVLTDDEKQEAELTFTNNLSDFNSVKALLDNLQDGGNTQALKTEVETAWPSEMWELRAELLGQSPHLSQEVLMAAADNTDVLPESILFEILAANPDELRQEELISYLENKEQPLPAYMISILRQLAGGITYKTILQHDMARYQAGKTQAAYNLIRSCLTDTVTDYAYLRTLLSNLDNLNADMQIVSAYLAEENFTAAQTKLNLIPATRSLEGNALTEYNDYKSMMQMQMAWQQQNSSIFELDSLEVDVLVNFAENARGKAALMAKGILEYAYGHNYCNCLPVDDAAAWKSSTAMPVSEVDNGLSIQAVPNPASTWVSFDFTLPVHVNEAVLQITDVHGRSITSFDLTAKQGQQVWDIREMKKGVYLYTLKAGAMSKNGKLIIN